MYVSVCITDAYAYYMPNELQQSQLCKDRTVNMQQLYA